ncbi:copper amine oxidase N-terminal domain-containing protein [Anoxynatronum buryatiense]|uniref:Copper amine oxidase N-terminal domain-containing protein n=1 Tax=Anoxynatronum buryatiense TaxID=489973 RepID=A0AA45WTN1_9CLOT|nr:copper amine oxidase N-terminal domain-containing protein [Anoxynatronum buryatiense]SMP42757.1 Copper amine oxidase N-terminal domain-containing protein [Anoxynatronum buryatiense]
MKKRMAKWLVMVLVLVMVMGGTGVYAQQPVQLMLDTEEAATSLVLKDGRAMISVDDLEELMGVDVQWQADELVLTYAEKTMVMTVGAQEALLDGESMLLDQPLIMEAEMLWVPLASVSRAFGHEVAWNASAKSVEIISRTNRLFSEYVKAIATTGALLLNGEMGDLHEAIVTSGEWDTPENEAFRTSLKEIKEASGATYVYTLIKSGTDEDPTLLISESDYPDEYGDEYEMESQFLKAFAGKPAYAVHFWDDEGTVMKSAFAPIYNSAGQVVAILGIDTVYNPMNHDANALISSKVKAIAVTGSLMLKGEMGDLHEVIVASGEWDTQENEAFRAVLKKIKEANGATYVYTLIKSGTDEDPTLLISESDYPDEYGDEYDMEPQFLLAFSGTPAAAQHIWIDDEVMKSAFAPIYNTAGEIVALLGIDMEAPELAHVPELD